MANDQLVLQINKINISPDKSYVKYNQNERGKVIDINVIDNDGINAYDLTNKKIRFVDEKEDNKLIIDDEADNPSHFTRANDTQGKFSYTFHDLVYQRSGIARFEIYTDSEHIDATANFEIQIENMTSTVVANESYISSLEGLVAHYRSTINTTETETNQLIDSLNKQITQAISDGKKSVADEVSSIKEIIQQMQTEYKSKSDTLAKLTSDWQTQTQTIQNSADDQLKRINENANSEIDKLKQDAANQLKSNQTANDAEINSVKQQLSDELAKVETDKTTAIQGITNARDKAISDATDKLTAKLQSIQADYDKWKTSTTGDFQTQIDKLSKELADDETDQASLRQAIDSAKEAVSKLHDVDFTVYAHKSDLANYYTKADTYNRTELDQKIDNAGKVKTVDGNSPDSNGNAVSKAVIYCDSPQAAYDASTKDKFHLYAYDMNNEAAEGYVAGQRVTIETLHNDIQTLQSQMSSKANTSDLANLGKVKTVNGNSPDSNGNVNVPAPDLSGYATKSDLATAGKMKTISVNGGAKVAPDANGNADITVATVDISGKADKTDITNLSNRITALEAEIADLKKSGIKLVGVTQAQYGALKTKDPNTIYVIGD
ncbi:hypothetical protein LA2_07605 [Lactobacillus amylovorus GRL 1112]|uniref:Minor tail protein gp31 C-terminal domain-containing protein n=1 Tax=Lactobacillus amylovorus (strain GRL 1112) TaxID=695560 RepID=E4SKP3_LACAR|nr:hypothetical protein [Lactobacillus amylovorus]ADQ59440.1 hypothetical protein LA2_07605 [Lactobacillus amylovorus GRL 1112]